MLKKDEINEFIGKAKIQPGDLIFGLEKSRQLVVDCLRKRFSTQEVWTIDAINNTFVIPSDREGTLKQDKELVEKLNPKSTRDMAVNFFEFMQEDTSPKMKTILSEHLRKDDESPLVRYSCQKAIEYFGSKKTQGTIHFILDGINLKRAMSEIHNECFTTSEIRSLFRFLKHQPKTESIKLYLGYQPLTVEMFFQLCGSGCENESPVKKTQLRERPSQKNSEPKGPLRHKKTSLSKQYPIINTSLPKAPLLRLPLVTSATSNVPHRLLKQFEQLPAVIVPPESPTKNPEELHTRKKRKTGTRSLKQVLRRI